ncbi:MAG: hypothetical protein JW918_18930 [Anaerolineae bacterium]|nr:hypothetical protein [Anaerolineae bacterium]
MQRSITRTTLLFAAIFTLTILSLACNVCGLTNLTEIDSAPARPSDPTDTPTPQPQLELKTSAGTLIIAKVELADSFPPGCSSGPTCSHAKEGYQVLILWLERPDGGDIREISDELFGETLPYLTSDSGAYVTASDGSKGRLGITHIDDDNNRFALVFGATDSGRDFTLTWPGNPPIDLGK